MTLRNAAILLAVAAILCLLFALLTVFPALAVGRDALFLGGVFLGGLALTKVPV
jgi:hypothetical protein